MKTKTGTKKVPIANHDKYYFMGYWFKTEDVKSKLAAITNLSEIHFDTDEDIANVIEQIVKDKPLQFTHFSKEMHSLRFGVRKNDPS